MKQFYELTLYAFADIFGATAQEIVEEFFPQLVIENADKILVRVVPTPENHFLEIQNPDCKGIWIGDVGGGMDLNLDEKDLIALRRHAKPQRPDRLESSHIY